MGATRIIAVECVPKRQQVARSMGADEIVDFSKEDPVDAILRITDGRGVDVSIEALGRQSTFEAALRVLRPGGTLASLGVYSEDLRIPLGPFVAGSATTPSSPRSAPAGRSACAA